MNSEAARIEIALRDEQKTHNSIRIKAKLSPQFTNTLMFSKTIHNLIEHDRNIEITIAAQLPTRRRTIKIDAAQPPPIYLLQPRPSLR